ncbi:GGDEF domain-containing protein [Thalassospira sp. NFXS8]|uniref:GGDEF domain-containing protein n=1 Tax=Thalassospira sp. NFXS8 TaxID=2819093 RepID=UPI0032DE3C7A
MKDVDLPLLQSLLKAASLRPDQKQPRPDEPTPELSTLIKHVHSLQTRLDQSENRVRQLENLLDTDDLTGLHNRRGFLRLLKQTLGTTPNSRPETSVIIADLDGFKKTNDQHGHAAGDTVLRHFAHILKKHLALKDFAGRLGGDEFAVALVNHGTPHGHSFIDRVKSSLGRSPVLWHHAHIAVVASFGVASSHDHRSLNRLLHSADMEMYRHKHGTAGITPKAGLQQRGKSHDPGTGWDQNLVS